MEVSVNLVICLVGDPKGDYKYLGEIEKGKRVVSYMFTDDTSTEDGVFLPVGTVQCYVVSGEIADLLMKMSACGLYGMIMAHKDVVQTDWGCWVVKMQKEEILSYVIQGGSVVDHKWHVEFLEYGTDYLLVAYEGV